MMDFEDLRYLNEKKLILNITICQEGVFKDKRGKNKNKM